MQTFAQMSIKTPWIAIFWILALERTGDFVFAVGDAIRTAGGEGGVFGSTGGGGGGGVVIVGFTGEGREGAK